jgi:hypothetical protein
MSAKPRRVNWNHSETSPDMRRQTEIAHQDNPMPRSTEAHLLPDPSDVSVGQVLRHALIVLILISAAGAVMLLRLFLLHTAPGEPLPIITELQVVVAEVGLTCCLAAAAIGQVRRVLEEKRRVSELLAKTHPIGIRDLDGTVRLIDSSGRVIRIVERLGPR